MLALFSLECLQHIIGGWIQQYQVWSYLLFMAVIFAETGLVVAPFLPGDSLLFVIGTFTANDGDGPQLSLLFSWLLLALAAVLGDSCNYWIGRFTGPKVFHKDNVRFLNKEYLHRAHEFYQRNGGKAVVIARFLPILRTFSPFVAGIGSMDYKRFLAFSISGSLAWIGLFVGGGYLFGGLTPVRQNFSLVIIGIIVISLTPAFITFMKNFFKKRKHPEQAVGFARQTQPSKEEGNRQ